MTLRTEIEALLDEFDHFAYRGAPLEVAVEKLQEILARTAPRVLTTVEELDSEAASRALCLLRADGSGILGFYRRKDGENEWAGVGSDSYFTSSELIADCANNGDKPAFTMVGREPDNMVSAGRKVLTTEAELNSEEAFMALCIMPYGGPLRTASSRTDGVNFWQEPGFETEYSSAELLAHFASIGAEPAFTVIEG